MTLKWNRRPYKAMLLQLTFTQIKAQKVGTKKANFIRFHRPFSTQKQNLPINVSRTRLCILDYVAQIEKHKKC